ncbi:hypothetical protein MJO29_003184 [Puccinia striiformis f. sp. tritici]|nr:hypothetical protein MJO29_003184 [Puccinia striiformis f. sp. tritici]
MPSHRRRNSLPTSYKVPITQPSFEPTALFDDEKSATQYLKKIVRDVKSGGGIITLAQFGRLRIQFEEITHFLIINGFSTHPDEFTVYFWNCLSPQLISAMSDALIWDGHMILADIYSIETLPPYSILIQYIHRCYSSPDNPKETPRRIYITSQENQQSNQHYSDQSSMQERETEDQSPVIDIVDSSALNTPISESPTLVDIPGKVEFEGNISQNFSEEQKSVLESVEETQSFNINAVDNLPAGTIITEEHSFGEDHLYFPECHSQSEWEFQSILSKTSSLNLLEAINPLHFMSEEPFLTDSEHQDYISPSLLPSSLALTNTLEISTSRRIEEENHVQKDPGKNSKPMIKPNPITSSISSGYEPQLNFTAPTNFSLDSGFSASQYEGSVRLSLKLLSCMSTPLLPKAASGTLLFPIKMSSTPSPNILDHPTIRTLGTIEKLKPPGPESNYGDWSWIMWVHFRTTGVLYVIKDKESDAKAKESWSRDNDAIVGAVSKCIHTDNIRNIRHLDEDARQLWETLKTTHQDSSAGGIMFWLQKLTSARMVDSDLNAHLDNMAKSFDRLNSLITPERPLTPQDIYSTALLTSLPPDWLSCVSSMTNQPRVDPLKLLDALRAEDLRRKTRSEDSLIAQSAAAANARQSGRSNNRRSGQPARHCTFCEIDGHDLNRCKNAARILGAEKSNPSGNKGKNTRQATKPSRSSTSDVKAGRTSAATLGSQDDESDYSGSEVEVTAGLAAVSLSSTLSPTSTGDANLDSGCSISMTPDISTVTSLKPDCTPVRLADHSTVKATHKGVSKLPIRSDKTLKTLVVPSLAEPLLSIAGLADIGLTAVFTKTSCDLYSTPDVRIDGTPIGQGYRKGNLYYLPSEPVSSFSTSTSFSAKVDNSLLGYHRRFSHLGLKPLKRLLKLNSLTPTLNNEIDVQQCPICVQSKMHRKAFKSRSKNRSTKPGQLIHSDVGSYEVVSREGYKYFSTFVDDCSKSISVFPMKSKSDTFSCFKIFRSFFEKDGCHTIQSLRTDNGGEYISKQFEDYLAMSGIKHEPGPPHSPELNGVAERTNRTISNLVRCSLLSANLPKFFWADAIRHCFFAYSSFPCNTPVGFKTPASILQQQPVNLRRLHPFGCLTYYKVPEANRLKLDKKARAAILLSYLSDGNGFRLWDLEQRTVIKSRDVVFHDDVFPYGSTLKTDTAPILVEIPWPDSPSPPTPVPEPPKPQPPHPPADNQTNTPSGTTVISLPNVPSPPAPSGVPSAPADSSASLHPTSSSPRRSSRARKAPERYGHWAQGAKEAEDVDTPKTWRQLLRSPNKNRWLKAADEEFASLLGMNTWRLVPRPQKRKIIKSKWVFKVKRHPDRSIQKLKARLVAMGYSQIQGLDYEEVFSPTLRLETLRLILSLLASRNWKGRQVDFKTAFLNGHLDHTVFMEQPPGFEDPQHPDWVCQLDRSLYGLKQSPRQWNAELHKSLLSLGLSTSKYDPTLYFKIQNNKLIGALTTHVDDLAIVGEPSFVDSLISSLGSKFKIGADDDLHHFLSLKITRDTSNRLIFLNQSHYIDELCDRFLQGQHVSVYNPADSNFKNLRKKSDGDAPSPGPYNQLIGSLLWVSQCTRPDISFIVNRLSQHLRDPSDAHWYAAVRVLNYLVSTKNLKLRLGGKLELSGYSDADWAEDRDDRKSTSAYTYRIGSGAISWKSRKQATVSLSSTEAEYKALSDSCKEGLWLRHLLSELHLRPNTAIPLHVDNEGAEALAKNPEHHARTKHIHARYHFVRECVQNDEISLLHVSTKDMLADMLTKPLNKVLLEKHRLMFGLVS